LRLIFGGVLGGFILLTLIVGPSNIFAQTENESIGTSVDQGDLLIASATIFAFFAFGTLFIITFQKTSNLTFLFGLLGGALFIVTIIEWFQIIIILDIVNGDFNLTHYTNLMLSTIVLFSVLVLLIFVMTMVNNISRQVGDISNTIVDDLTSDLRTKLSKK